MQIGRIKAVVSEGHPVSVKLSMCSIFGDPGYILLAYGYGCSNFAISELE
jgi:hypothetical protein